MVPDDRFDGIVAALNIVSEEHRKLHDALSYSENPEFVHFASYQDGLIHAFERICQRRNSGEYSCPTHVMQLVDAYHDIQCEKRHRKKYTDVAYAEGYINGLEFLLLDDKTRKLLPLYFLFGSDDDIRTLRHYKRAAKAASNLHKASYRQAVELTKRLQEGLAFHHTPFLL